MSSRPPNKLSGITTSTFLSLWLRDIEDTPVLPYQKAKTFLVSRGYINPEDEVKTRVSNYNINAVKMAITMNKLRLLRSGLSYFLVKASMTVDEVSEFLKDGPYVNTISARASLFMEIAGMVGGAKMRIIDWKTLKWVLSMPEGTADLAMMDVPSNIKGRMLQSAGDLASKGLIEMRGSVAYPIIPKAKAMKVINPQCTDRPPPALYDYAEEVCLNLG